jgi:hypothetical protein
MSESRQLSKMIRKHSAMISEFEKSERPRNSSFITDINKYDQLKYQTT